MLVAVVFFRPLFLVVFSQSLSVKPVYIPRIYTQLVLSLSYRDVLTLSESSQDLGNEINPTKGKRFSFNAKEKIVLIHQFDFGPDRHFALTHKQIK
jgi:hypothetical protein